MNKKLSQRQLENMISECVNEVLNETRQLKKTNRTVMTEGQMQNYIKNIINEEIENEGWFGDKWNQTKSAFNTFTNNEREDNSLSDRWARAKKNWSTQGDLNSLQSLRTQLSQFIDDGQIDPSTTVAQLVGGKYNNNKFGKLTGKIANRRKQISNRGGSAY